MKHLSENQTSTTLGVKDYFANFSDVEIHNLPIESDKIIHS